MPHTINVQWALDGEWATFEHLCVEFDDGQTSSYSTESGFTGGPLYKPAVYNVHFIDPIGAKRKKEPNIERWRDETGGQE